MRKPLLFGAFLAASLAGAGGAFAVEINVLSAGAVQEAEKAIAVGMTEKAKEFAAAGGEIYQGILAPHDH